MRVTKLGHACIRLEHDGHVIVIDPGGFTEREAVDGATAVLITHEHGDHLDLGHLAATDAPVFTVEGVAAQIRVGAPAVAERTTVVAPGESFDVGLPARAVGERHAVIHESIPVPSNSGYVVSAGGTTLFHPGDSFELPGEDVDLFCLPVSAPWTKLAEVMEHAKAVGAPRTLAVHDRILSEVGLALTDDRVAAYLEGIGDYVRLPDGAEL
ncbi:MBL fold metallo-hydrolase [Marmoricola endophyticus]|uniref:MBL fold metallo-hydrolase n=1 Tax=Marmoricola endophyticus TaxID=2040280 RepID=A0A917BNK6_9ACTN|nr:MBL fold metallo-hydrolase [Marmoricola endophyticus]GGF50874.1 MBL fold metallo-hydrolase [Marmoricola endophyticus]